VILCKAVINFHVCIQQRPRFAIGAASQKVGTISIVYDSLGGACRFCYNDQWLTIDNCELRMLPGSSISLPAYIQYNGVIKSKIKPTMPAFDRQNWIPPIAQPVGIPRNVCAVPPPSFWPFMTSFQLCRQIK